MQSEGFPTNKIMTGTKSGRDLGRPADDTLNEDPKNEIGSHTSSFSSEDHWPIVLFLLFQKSVPARLS